MSSSQERYLIPLSTLAMTVAVVIAIILGVPQIFPGVRLPFPGPGHIAEIPAVVDRTQDFPNNSRNFVTAAVNRVGAAVVRIDTERTVTTAPNPFFDDPFFRRFFGEDAFPDLPRERRVRGQGSGFIVDRSGIILTNAHVVSGAEMVTVNLRDGRTLRGEVRGIDDPSDLAVVKIEGSNLPVAPLGSSSELQVGDWAIAVGNPLGLDNTVSLGIISALSRSSAQVGIPDKRLDFLQTDAAINPGNSGGPLLNDRGEVIGINTAIRPGAEGINFAIPIDRAKAIQDRLARGETIPHPYIGIRMLTLTPELAKTYNDDPNSPYLLPEINGVLVVQVVPDSPAAKAGLRRGDVVTDIEGTEIVDSEQLQTLVENSEIGEPLMFEVQRGDLSQQISVRPGELLDAGR
ncbi:MAG: HhoA/HhoB/HtrA family serine endopeptidase [Synechococcus sp.]